MPSGAKRERLARIYRLWDELADFPAGQMDAALVHLMETLCGWLGADSATWVGGVLMAHGAPAKGDLQHGWRGRAVRRLSPPIVDTTLKEAVRGQDTEPGMTTCALTAEAGIFRVRRLKDGFIDFEAFSRTDHYQAFYVDLAVTDRLWAVFPVNQDAESYLFFDINHGRRSFSAADAALAEEALRGLKWFHRNLMLSYGLVVANTPLTPTQQRVLGLLLTGKPEKEVAALLGQSAHTTHTHVKEILRKFGVTSRTGLMAFWLGQTG